jgi:glycogen debranching enzyme
LKLNGKAPLVLTSTGDSGFSQEQVLGNHLSSFGDQSVGRATIQLIRHRYLSEGLTEDLTITNYNQFGLELTITYQFDADFCDIFEVRGHERERPGHLLEPEFSTDTLTFRYLGADGVWRRSAISFNPAPDRISKSEVEFNLNLASRGSRAIQIHVETDESAPGEAARDAEMMRTEYAFWRRSFADLYTNNGHFNSVIQRSIDDLRTLWTQTDDGGYFAAGVPWYSTLFGRDSVISALQVLPLKPEVAKQCLLSLAKYQAHAFDKREVQEPGKILHEMRQSELNVVHELPYQTYYGSVDSPPLFLLLAVEYYRWTADLETLASLKGHIEAAIRWIRKAIDKTPGPYLRYDTDAATGLRNQGWKDSAEAIMHEDGSLCDGPIALVEVQAYVFSAFKGLSPLLAALGNEELAETLLNQAGELKMAFDRDFWLPGKQLLGLALDGNDRLTPVGASNAGQALWGGILDQEQASAVTRRLFTNEMFSGWGIRTLSSNEDRYFPLGYHLGTIWPHDNALIAAGLKRYGFDDEVLELFTGLFDAAQYFPAYRLPELFGGQPRTHYLPPVPYPVACRPQAWAAGALLQLMLTTLGLQADAANNRLVLVRPCLPFWLDLVQMDDLRVGEGKVNLRFERVGDRTTVFAESDSKVVVEVIDAPQGF